MNPGVKLNSDRWKAKSEQLYRWTGLQIEKSRPEEFRWTSAVAIVSSHQSKHPEWSSQWRSNLQHAISRCKQENKVVLYSRDNPMGFWIEQFAKRFSAATVRVELSQVSKKVSADRCDSWLQLNKSDDGESEIAAMRGLPLIDRALFALADIIIAINIRRGSKTEQLSRKWLEINYEHRSKFFVCATRDPKASDLHEQDDLARLPKIKKSKANCSRRAVEEYRWQCEIKNQSDHVPSSQAICIASQMFQRSSWNSSDYLVHCTRSRSGKYPLQSDDGYATEMMVDVHDLLATPLETLRQILIDQRLIATTMLKRDGHASVSFSNVPILELLQRRRYQKHLQRWDWEPYGLGIRKESLIARNAARPVHYVRNANEATDTPVWLCQPAQSADSLQNWEAEREWRTPIDVRLSVFESHEVFVFVAHAFEARQLACLSRFPIAIVSES